jgi:hypothetical protein
MGPALIGAKILPPGAGALGAVQLAKRDWKETDSPNVKKTVITIYAKYWKFFLFIYYF